MNWKNLNLTNEYNFAKLGDLKTDKGAIFILTEDPKVWLDIVRNPGQLEWSMVKETSKEVEKKIKSLLRV